MLARESMTCREFVNRSTDLLEGAVAPEISHALGEHADACPNCRRYLTQIEATMARAQELDEWEKPSQELVEEFMRVVGVGCVAGSSESAGKCHLSDTGLVRDFLEDRLPAREQIALLEHLILGCEQCSRRCVSVVSPELSGGSLVRRSLNEPEPETQVLDLYRTVLGCLLTSEVPEPVSLIEERGVAPEPFLLWLIGDGRDRLVDRPEPCCEMARLAVSIAATLGEEYRARAAMFRGHVERLIRCDFVEADRWFSAAERHLRSAGGGYPLGAKLLRLKGRARFTQSRNSEALCLYGRAAEIYRDEGDLPRLGETNLELAAVLHEHVGPERAVVAIYAASGFVDWRPFPRFAVVVGQNLSDFYSHAGRPERAAQALALSRRWLPKIGRSRLLELHLAWSQGKILSAAGRYREALDVLSEARSGFLELDQAGQAIFIALDLAIALLHLGRFDDVRHLSLQMLAYFASRRVSNELMASIRLMASAAASRSLTRAHIWKLAESCVREEI